MTEVKSAANEDGMKAADNGTNEKTSQSLADERAGSAEEGVRDADEQEKTEDKTAERIQHFRESKGRMDDAIFVELLKKHLPATLHQLLSQGHIILTSEIKEAQTEVNS